MKKLVVILFLLVALVSASSDVFAVETPLTATGGTISVVSIEFNSGNSTLYGIVKDGSVCKFVSINLATGQLTTLNSNIGLNTEFGILNVFGTSCIDPATNTYYAVKAGVAAYASKVVSINLGTGIVTVSPELHF